MSLKAALQADLAAKGMNLGDLADKLGITQQSVSKWIAKDEIPKDRLEEVMNLVKPGEHLTHFLLKQMQQRLHVTNKLSEEIVAANRLRNPPQPGDDGDDVPLHFSIDFAEQPRRVVNRTVEIQSRTQWAALERWGSQLSDATRSYVKGTLEINEAHRQFDYLSPKLAILVRATPSIDATRLIPIAVPLMLLKRVRPSVQCWLVLFSRQELGIAEPNVRMDESTKRIHARRMITVKADLDMLGVKVIELQSIDDLAPRIEAAEKSEEVLAAPPFSYEDYLEEL